MKIHSIGIKQLGVIIAFALIMGCQPLLHVDENVLIKEVYNPRQALKVVVFEKGGNATLDNSIHYLLAGYDYELGDSDTGNILIMDKVDGLSMPKEQIFSAEWKNDSTLVISYPNAVRVYKRLLVFESFMGRITIDYNTCTE